MAERDYDDSDFADIHQALGIQSTNPAELIGRHPVLQIVPSSLPTAGIRGAEGPSMPNLPEGYSFEPGLSGAGQYLRAPNGDYLSFDSASPGGTSRLQQTARQHVATGRGADLGVPQRTSVEDVLASPTREGFNALTAPEQTDYMSRVFFSAPHAPYDALSDHLDNLLGSADAGRNARLAHGRGPVISSWIDNYYNALAAGGQPTRPDLSDSAISAHLARNPGASIADVAGLSQPVGRPATAADMARLRGEPDLASQTGMTSGALGDLPKAVRDAIVTRVGPHMSESDFADKYFGGMYHPDNFVDSGDVSSAGNSLHFEGRLRDPNTGSNIGSISRTIYPDYAYHGYLSVQPNARGTGAVPAMLSNQVDLYKKMGLSSVQLSANIDVGSYAWAKYGFVPKTQGAWDALRNGYSGRGGLKSDWQAMKPQVDPDQADHVDRILADPDPHAIWDLADVPYKAPQGFGQDDNTTIGKALLMNRSWPGKLDLNGEDSMQRFNDYVRSKMK
jgi:hypothetical protein